MEKKQPVKWTNWPATAEIVIWYLVKISHHIGGGPTAVKITEAHLFAISH